MFKIFYDGSYFITINLKIIVVLQSIDLDELIIIFNQINGVWIVIRSIVYWIIQNIVKFLPSKPVKLFLEFVSYNNLTIVCNNFHFV